MNRYLMIHHLRWPAVLLLTGTLALLAQLDVIDHFWHWFWPLLLILIGVIMLAERAALATMDNDDDNPWPYGGTPAPPAPQPETSIVPAKTDIFGRHSDGGNQ
ncbi:MAG TPA: DUF5668 domain-containing protein [Terracidiphilus sp.]|nr:DUF5668 domain-containing protein [Terracidiphilus sp.]